MKRKIGIALALGVLLVGFTCALQKAKPKNLYAIYESHSQRNLSNKESHRILEDYPGTYAIFCEGLENDFTDGHEMYFGDSKVILFKEKREWGRFSNKKFLDYMYDSIPERSHSRDVDTVISWIARNAPAVKIFQDQPLHENPEAVTVKERFRQTFTDTAVVSRLRFAYAISTRFENEVIKTLAGQPNAHVILGVAHARVVMMLCRYHGFTLADVRHPGMTDEVYNYFVQSVLVKYLVLEDSVYTTL